MDFRLQLKDELYKKLMRQIQADAGLLERMHVMDYSLLLGIHYTEDSETNQKVRLTCPLQSLPAFDDHGTQAQLVLAIERLQMIQQFKDTDQSTLVTRLDLFLSCHNTSYFFCSASEEDGCNENEPTRSCRRGTVL